MRIRLEEQLQQLNLEMIKMGVLCEDAINNSIDILFDAGSDAEKKKRKYKEVRRADSEIDHQRAGTGSSLYEDSAAAAAGGFRSENRVLRLEDDFGF